MTEDPGFERERDDALDRLTVRYADEYRAGRSPRPDEYIRQHPQYARELADFFVYFHTVAVDLPDPDPVPVAQLTPAALAAQARIQRMYAQQYALAGLAKRSIELGVAPPTLAANVGLSPDLFARLEARAIAAASIPRTLIRRLAAALQVAPEAVALYLSGGASQAGRPAAAFFFADTPPQIQQDSFLAALRASALPPDGKRAWEEIAREEGIDN